MSILLRRAVLVEALLYLCVVAVTALLVALGAVGATACVWVAIVLLTGLFLMSWRNFDRGRHPVFLFLGMLLMFQAGRLVGYVFGIVRHPMRIAVQAPYPVSVSSRVAEMTLLVIVLSAICIYLPCALTHRPTRFCLNGRPGWMGALYVVIGLTLPFAFYKSLLYLMYIRAHGGYIAIFTQNSEVLAQAGVGLRVMALLGPTALIVAYVFETRASVARSVLVLYAILAALDLVIGMRGRFFSEMVAIWFLRNLKRNRGFRLAGLLAIAVAASLLATWIGAFREEQSVSMISPAGFLAVQGASMNVTEAAIAFRHVFGQYALHYLWNGFWNGIHPIVTLEHGRMWTTDLSMLLNPLATRLGFGTASSYLAELYLLAGLPAVIAGSLLVGTCLAALHRIASRAWGMVGIGLVLPSLIYLPRLELLNPLASALKGLASLTVVAVLTLACWKAMKSLARATRPVRWEEDHAG